MHVHAGEEHMAHCRSRQAMKTPIGCHYGRARKVGQFLGTENSSIVDYLGGGGLLRE